MQLTTRQYLDILKEQVENGKEVSMVIAGNSMSPFLEHGRDSIYFSAPSSSPKRGDIAFFQREDGQYVVHRLVKKDKSGCYFLGDNQTNIEGPLPENSIFAIVTKAKRKGRIIGPKSFIWFFFKHIWINIVPFRHPVMAFYRMIKNHG